MPFPVPGERRDPPVLIGAEPSGLMCIIQLSDRAGRKIPSPIGNTDAVVCRGVQIDLRADNLRIELRIGKFQYPVLVNDLDVSQGLPIAESVLPVPGLRRRRQQDREKNSTQGKKYRFHCKTPHC